jgi:thiol-disulfide isomerase/thioredoxin
VILTILLNIVSFYKSRELNKEKFPLSTMQLLDTTYYTINDDKPTLIYFWATWCPICKLESNHIQTLSKYFEVITIAVDSGSNKQIQDYLDLHKLTFKVYNDSKKKISNQLNIKGYPTILIYNKDKNLITSDIGYTSLLTLYLKILWAEL